MEKITNRYDIIEFLIRRRGYWKYLEIGTQSGDNFNNVPLKYKIGVDPDSKARATLKMTSDDFFSLSEDKFDIIFIDGLHHANQFYNDISNALHALATGGTIVCHDVNPASEEMQRVPRTQKEWTGDVWKSWVYLRSFDSDLHMYVVDIDYGCGIIRRGKQELISIPARLTYKKLKDQRVKLLNLKSIAEFKNIES
ncbi:MAG: class I SAM-dependent methyltransferase [Bacteroidales bacterium]